MKDRIEYLTERWDSPEAERVGVWQEMDQGNAAWSNTNWSALQGLTNLLCIREQDLANGVGCLLVKRHRYRIEVA